ncbi:MAG: family 20 glycosylhydrolase, partial [Armatimonadota bacterium]|nr:family 20 glycosylhydrolase [Armatimonadota bacterium]
NLHLAEDPEHPYGYCPSNPESYKFIFDIYVEAIEIFKPKVFHIGHDEIKMRGRFPRDELCSRKTVSQLFIEDVKKLHAYLSERGIRTMLWGDMMLHKSETPDAAGAESVEAAKERREALPKDVIIADWHYCSAKDFPSVRIFKENGNEVLACTWYNPYNIQDFSRSAKKDGAEGLIQTLWSGFNVDERCLDQQFHQYHAFILAADYAWNTGETSVDDIPYFPAEEFMKLWRREKADHIAKNGFVIDLSSLANIILSGDDTSAWLGCGPDHDLRSFKTGNIRLRGIRFETPKNKALMLSGALNPNGSLPCSVHIPLGRTAEGLEFLLTAGWGAEKGTAIGKIVIRYSNIESMVLDLVYGENIAAWNDASSVPFSAIAWKGKTKAGEKITLRMLHWDNPYPEKPIQEIEITSNNTEACPVVFAITGIGG